ncbi:Ankyrin repeat domain-containing protein 60 [Myotis davidii]|uniref:Ankyrin repeat domain-containing protein 60 n=1 Tax=Myotis davidii TaxID=225400 RepID=L5M5N3_MYODS|nr:Ankyrin repeat domain-containing protein 60 [Myotis davidii]
MALDLAPDVFVMRVLLEETGEMFTVTDCHGDMTVQELKEQLDLTAGIPLNLQLLQYLDQEPQISKQTLSTFEPRALALTQLLSCLGVSEDSPYRTPTLHYLGEKQRKKWIAQRAFVALYVASHRGHVEAVQYLLEKAIGLVSSILQALDAGALAVPLDLGPPPRGVS